MEPRLSIIVPVRNRAEIVGRTLASIASQPGIEQTEIILVDNGSTDGTLDALKRWTESPAAARLAVKVLTEPRPGACAARNRGLAAATALWTMFFDSDDEMGPVLVGDILAAAVDPVEVVVWPISIQLPDGRFKTTRLPESHFLRDHLFHAILSTQRYAARTDLFRRVGGWDERLQSWNDLELGVRILLQRPVIALIEGMPRATTYFTEDSLTGRRHSDSAQWRELSLDTCEADLAEAGHSTAAVDIRRAVLAAEYRREGARDEARRLLASTVSRCGAMRSAVVRLLYFKHLLYPRGTARLGAFLLGVK